MQRHRMSSPSCAIGPTAASTHRSARAATRSPTSPAQAFHGWRYSDAHAAALYPQAGTANDGKIVLVGEHDTKYGAVFALARFNANGTLDSTFGSDKKNPGEVTTTFATTGDPYQEAFGVFIQSDGKIVVAGTSSSGGFVLARYKTNGALDKTFGTGGEVITPFSGGVASGGTLLVQPNGKLLLVGETHPSSQTWVPAMARYNSDGSLDTSFGTGGLLSSSVTVNGYVKAALYPPGTANAGEFAVLAKTPYPSNGNVEIARFRTNGTLDTTFGSGGTVTGPPGENPNAVIAPDGKLVVSFSFTTSMYDRPQFGVARFNSDGSPDNTFGTNGYVRSPLGGYVSSTPSAVALQSDGEIVAAGGAFFTAYNAYYPKGVASSNFAVARYLPSEPDIGALSPTSNSDGSTLLTASNLTDGNPNSIIAKIEFFYLDDNGNKISLGYGALDGTGAWKLTVTLSAGTTLYAQAEDNYGAFGAPLALTL